MLRRIVDELLFKLALKPFQAMPIVLEFHVKGLQFSINSIGSLRCLVFFGEIHGTLAS